MLCALQLAGCRKLVLAKNDLALASRLLFYSMQQMLLTQKQLHQRLSVITQILCCALIILTGLNGVLRGTDSFCRAGLLFNSVSLQFFCICLLASLAVGSAYLYFLFRKPEQSLILVHSHLPANQPTCSLVRFSSLLLFFFLFSLSPSQARCLFLSSLSYCMVSSSSLTGCHNDTVPNCSSFHEGFDEPFCILLHVCNI